MKTKTIAWFTTLILAALVLAACGPKAPASPTATPVDVNAVAAQAIQTFSMGLTMTALAQPTATVTPAPTDTVAPLPTFILVNGTGTPAAAPTSSCDVSTYIQDITVPDNTVVAPGQKFLKKWEVKNTGTCTWSPTYTLGFAYGDPMCGSPVTLGKTVAPGASVVIEIPLTAPATAGNVTSVWRLQNDQKVFFGTVLTVAINVAGTPPTTAAPSTETPEATVTAP